MKQLSDYDKKKRENSELYFKNGRPKKKYMLCRDLEYIKEIVRINGSYDLNWTCGGSRCLFYTCGCDDRGRDWE